MKAQLLSLLLVCSVMAAKPTTGFVRQSDQSVPIGTNGTQIDFLRAKDGHLSFAIHQSSDTGSERISFENEGVLKAKGWFLYIESSSQIWAFDGTRDVIVIRRSPTGFGVFSLLAKPVRDYCPKAVWDAIPVRVRERLRKSHADQ